MPDIFTPNGDGTNENHVPIETAIEDLNYLLSHIETIQYTVYNRWGRVVYMSEGVLPRWDGRLLDTGDLATSGTYYWILHYTDVSKGDYTSNGFVHIVR